MQKDQREQIKLLAESDLAAFIRLVHPNRVLGSVHTDLIQWWTRPDAKSHQLTLLPRDHQKSALVGYRVAHAITVNPAIRILYISSTANLATKQLKFIKDILTSDIYRFYWPEMVKPEEGKREKWTEGEMSVDHPLRKEENVRDPTVFTAGLTTNIAGMHCDVTVMDDVVVIDNAYTEEARAKVKQQYSLLSSIEGTDSRQWIVGTRYHPKDLYNDLQEISIPEYSNEGEQVGENPLYEVFQKQVESRGDGTGEFLWPRQQRRDGKWFGFDQDILAKKRGQYLDKVQFRAQYYNDPNDPEGGAISSDCFQYYDKKFLKNSNGYWYFQDRRLNIYAAVDFAYSLSKKSDYSAIAVVGVDGQGNYYVLEIDRFKASFPSDYFKHILALHTRWDIRRLRAECTAAQQVIVNSLKSDYIRPQGLSLSIEEVKPTRNEGNKEERIEAVLENKYRNRQIWHYKDGNCQILEEELILQHPAHDDMKDALAMAIASCQIPTAARRERPKMIVQYGKFGGVS